MRHHVFVALGLVSTLAACTSGPPGGGFSESPSPAIATPIAPAQLDTAALQSLRDRLASALAAHATDHVSLSWGPGAAYQHPGPYRDEQLTVDALGLLAAAGAPSLGGHRNQLAAATVAQAHSLDGPQGAAYLLLERAFPGAATGCSSGGDSSRGQCLLRQISDGLMAAWYARDTKSFFHLGDTSTVYRPVEAIAVGCALALAGFREQNFDKIDAGQAIVEKELKADFDDHFGMVYSLMTASAGGGRQPTDFTTRLADQAGIAQMLLQTFDVSREQTYLLGSAKALQPFADEKVALRGRGYLTGFDLRGSGPDTQAVDVEAGLLVLQAARHYDRDDGNHFARLEETAAKAVTDSASAADPGDGLPAALQPAGATVRSGVVTALGVLSLNDVLSAR
jgi:hypothetical protein